MIRSGYIAYVNITDNIFYEHIYMCLYVCVCVYIHTEFLPGKSHGQKRLLGYSPWSCKRVRYDAVTKHHHTHTHNHEGKERHSFYISGKRWKEIYDGGRIECL